MIMGDRCTRGCAFCNVSNGRPSALQEDEPDRIAEAVQGLGIRYAVITSVTRDDLEDRGAGHFRECVRKIREKNPETLIELLIPDMGGDRSLIERVASSGADVIGHNVEMPEELYPRIRPDADYRRSLRVLGSLAVSRGDPPRYRVKSSLMLGLGESAAGIEKTLGDIRERGVDIIYMGQYLRPGGQAYPVKRYYTPEEFSEFAEKARAMGFRAVRSGPLVRSSYLAGDAYAEAG
jgi:lipoic acid synthetase